MTLLIAFDGSEHAKAAIRGLCRAGIPGDAAAIVTAVGHLTGSHVYAPPIPPRLSRRASGAVMRARTNAAGALREARRLAHEGAALVRQYFPTWDVESEARLGRPERVIVDGARERRVDLIVVGARGRSALGRLLLGSVSRYVATNATASVLVSRHAVDRDAPVRIVVGLDGSSSARTAVESIATRNWADGTEVQVTAVADTHGTTSTLKRVPTAAAWVAESNRARRETARAALAHSVELLAAAGLKVSADINEGTASRILAERAAELDADTIVVGSRSLGTDAGPTPGADIVAALAASATCSVEVVR
jgi:nucleotide-binding universal stress UspA family protein